MRTFDQVKAWARPILDDADYDKVKQFPGPKLPDIPQAYIMWSRYGGPGLDDTDFMDDISWQARVVGRQNKYNEAETIADLIDVALLSIHSSHIGGVWVTRVQRVGGAPTVLEVDDADRTHFVCSYIIGTELALTSY